MGGGHCPGPEASFSSLLGLSRGTFAGPLCFERCTKYEPSRSGRCRHVCSYRRYPGGAARAGSHGGRARSGDVLPLHRGLSKWDPCRCRRDILTLRLPYTRALYAEVDGRRCLPTASSAYAVSPQSFAGDEHP